MGQWVYAFGDGKADGNAAMKDLLGGKGANLAEMSALGLPVPPGFTLTTEACNHFTSLGDTYPDGFCDDVATALKAVEASLGLGFGDPDNVLLVSVRSGSRASMPGMMDTVLNLGLNDDTVRGLAEASGDARFAYDSYRRFIQMYGDVVLGVGHENFEDILADYKDRLGATLDTELTVDDWRVVIGNYLEMVEEKLGRPFPEDPHQQLWGAIDAVFKSWMNRRARTYRRLHDIPESWGTAVNVQAMVFGNMGDDCGTGVAFTRDPATGENEYYGEYLINAQGEDVVAGIRTPQSLTIAAQQKSGSKLPSMEETMPGVFVELMDVRSRLEKHYKDIQDMEFTVQQGRLWMLQTRTGKRTTKAAIKIAVDMVNEGLIDKKQAVGRIDPAQLDQILHPMLDPAAERELLGRGLPASPGAASGRMVFNSDDAETWCDRGEKVILVRIETSPEDIGGMHVAKGILTTRGGMTSHAAVVARGMGTPCVSGAGILKVDYKEKTLTALGEVLREGDMITIDGSSGEIMKGAVATIQPDLSDDFDTLMAWVDDMRVLGVRANAETPTDAAMARKFGAEGIGLARTEHMFFDSERIIHVREMIVADTPESRAKALAALLPHQRQDFVDLFEIMDGLPVTIRLLDPPLHEFLPSSDADLADVAKAAGVTVEDVRARAAQLHEFNPMLGHRGCRLGLTYPDIYEMQARAIFEATVIATEAGQTVKPEIMIPLVALEEEFRRLKDLVDATARAVAKEKGVRLDYTVGTMIELPRACLRAGDIAKDAAFFSFGTNDLTQTALGLSRDDASSFIQIYRDQGIVEADPFATIDVDGVGELVRIAVERGRAARPDIKIGICGEHGGDPASVEFFHQCGLDYVSCSPYRVPIARLAAAQAAIHDED
ncbi:MAG: pyruvate, phosphate dikinase [Alphaproteobacteria bacterium]